MDSALELRFYCNGSGDHEITDRLGRIHAAHGIRFVVADLSRNGEHDWDRNREVYEKDFKPRAKTLKRRTGEPITGLRSRSGRYYVSIPGTLSVVRNGAVEWFCMGKPDILDALDAVLKDGPSAIERLM